MSKTRFNYDLVGLSKDEDNNVTFNGELANNVFPEVSKLAMQGYGTFAFLTRALATSSDKPYTTKEIKDILTTKWTALKEGNLEKAKTGGIVSNEAKLEELNKDIAGLNTIANIAKDKATKEAIGKMVSDKIVIQKELIDKIAKAKAKKTESSEVKK
jgi:ribosomal protein L29